MELGVKKIEIRAPRMNPSPSIKHISECFIKPKHIPEESKQPLYLAPWDLAMVTVHYIQKGLLFKKPPNFSTQKKHNFLQSLKDSVSSTLVHFYPLAGRLATIKQEENPPIYSIYIDCINSPGARFIHSSLDLTINDIISPLDVPQNIVQSFFDHDRAINHDAHEMSLLTVQITELIDGIFIGCSLNHMVVDGTSFWHFFNSWSEIFNANGEKISISRPPIHKRWIPEGYGPILSLPFTHHDQFIQRYEAPLMRERIFHFSSESLKKLKAKANSQCNTTKISSLQVSQGFLKFFFFFKFIHILFFFKFFLVPLKVKCGVYETGIICTCLEMHNKGKKLFTRSKHKL